jgi:hypothetical protein
MSVAEGRTAATRPARSPARERPLPFWVLQLSELIAAVVLVDVSVHVRGGGLLIVAAVAFALLAAVARGPLGLVRLCPQRLHVSLVVAAAALAAAAPAVPALRPDIEGIIVLEFAAVGVIRVATLTRTSDQPRRVGRGRTVIDATASVVDLASAPAPPPRQGPSEPDRARRAHQAGRAAGAAAATGRRLVETHGPAAEAHLKRSIRQAGRWAGRFRSRASDRRSPEG